MSKVLVTGGAGFIGANFIYYMLEKYNDYKIVNLDKLTYASKIENLKNYIFNELKHSLSRNFKKNAKN